MSLCTKNLGFYYKKSEWIFRNINLEVNPGKILAISGYSGRGKTSFAKVLADYLKPKEGEVLVDGDTHHQGKYRKVQLIHQHPELFMNPKWKMNKILEESYLPSDEIIEAFGIRKEWLDRYPIELSGGELQRFSIVRSLNPNTKYLIADEMTTMLDAVTQAFIWKKLLKIIRDRSIGLIIISHEKEIINKLADDCFYI